ncbi:MAG: hypothetical protein NTZ39_03635 [Methanoregula sp.]|nr:hypothetical protein [Methanoregula sp.]
MTNDPSPSCIPANGITRAIQILAEPGQVVEIRALADNATHSGYFTDHTLLSRQVEALDADPSIHGIYVTLNVVNPALLSRRANRIKLHLSRGDATTSDADIIRRRWLPVDIDPVRPSGVSSTDAEHELALAKADEIAGWLAGIGFPDPVTGDSGNGAHLLYRINLPNDEAATALVKACLAMLDLLFSDEQVTVDKSIYNAGRIWKLYGTVARKGDSTSERPHRRSRIISAPDDVAVVTAELLQNLAAQLPAEPGTQPAAGKEHAIDLRSWLVSHGITIRSEKPYRDGTIYTLAQCPFSSAHKDGAYAIQFASGAVHAACHHASCGARKQRWQELQEKYETTAEKHERQEERIKEWSQERAKGKTDPGKTADKTPGSLPGDDPEPPEFSESHTHKALEILEHGDPRAFILATYTRVHVGDELVGECYLASFLSSSITNSRGLHCCPTGDSGKGKSDSARGFLRMVPRRYKIQGSITSKALFYHKIPEGSVIIFDDFEMSEDLREVLKNATSDFHVPLQHLSLNTNREPVTLYLPPRCVWWILSVDNPGDDQVLNRMLVPWIDDSEVQDRRVKDRVFSMAAAAGDSRTSDEDLPVVRALLHAVRQNKFYVRIPFAERITMENIRNRRNPIMLLDMTSSYAALNFRQRESRVLPDGTIELVATEQDFLAAARLFTALDTTGGGQTSKLLKNERVLIDTVIRMKVTEFTVTELQKWLGITHNHVWRTLHGRMEKNRTFGGGLLAKCPALGVVEMMTTDEDAEKARRRKENHYMFDPVQFIEWNRGGGVYLSPDPPGDGSGPAPLPMGNDRAKVGQRSRQFSKTNPEGSSSNPGSDTENNSSTGTTFAQDPENVREHISGTVACEQDHIFTYCLGKMGKGDPKTQEINQNPNSAAQCGIQNCPDLCPIVAHKENPGNTGNSPANQSGVIPLPGVLSVQEFRKVDPALFGRCDVCSVLPVAYRDEGTHTSLCRECYGRLVREGNVSGQTSYVEPGRSGLAAEQNGGKV